MASVATEIVDLKTQIAQMRIVTNALVQPDFYLKVGSLQYDCPLFSNKTFDK
jgi:hypothetical protein